MPKKKRDKAKDGLNETRHAFDHVNKNEFLAALSGDFNIPRPPTNTNHDYHRQMPITSNSSSSLKRKREETAAPARARPDSKRVKESEFNHISTARPPPAFIKTTTSFKINKPSLHNGQGLLKKPVDGTSSYIPGLQALQSQIGANRDPRSQAVPIIAPQPRRPHAQPSQLLSELQHDTKPKVFRSSRTGLESEMVPQTRAAMSESGSLQQLGRCHTPGIASGSESEGGYRTPRSKSGRRTPSTPGRSPYVQNVKRPPVQVFVPNQHESRKLFRERAERQVNERTQEEIKARGGMLVPSEKEIVNTHSRTYQQQNGMSNHEFAEFVQSRSSESLDFLVTVHELLPYRSRKAIFDYMRRVFHNFKPRGQWTKEEDEKLSEAVGRLGHKWILISHEMNRHNEDCAERYKNYHHVKDQKLTKWDEVETELLRSAVGTVLLSAVKQGTKDIARHGSTIDERTGLPEWVISEAEASRMVMWQTIASHVPHRSRLQCYMRWGVLRKNGASSYVWELARAMKREGHTKQIVEGMHIIPQGKAVDAPKGIRIYPHDDAQNIGKIVGRRKTKEMYGGDKLDLMQYIQDNRIKRDEDIDWDKIRRVREGLEIFPDMMLAGEWEDAKAKYETAKDKSLQGVKTYKAAKKVKKWLKKNLTEVDKSRRWSTMNMRQKTPESQGDQSPKKSHKSDVYVGFEDRTEPALGNRNFTVGSINAELNEARGAAGDYDDTDEDVYHETRGDFSDYDG